MNDSIRILHDGDWPYPGGGERVAIELGHALDAPFTVLHTSNPEFWKDRGLDVEFAFQEELRHGVASRLYESVTGIGDVRMAQLARSCEFEETTIVSTGSAAKWWIPSDGQRHIHYCHTPPPQFYAEPTNSFVGWGYKTVAGMVDSYFAGFVDRFIANSEFTEQRIEQYYNRGATVIHPPIQTRSFYHEPPTEPRYFVMIGRLNSMKRALTVARAFSENPDIAANLVLIGDGPQKSEIAQMENVSVLSDVPDWVLHRTIACSVGGIAFAEGEHCGMTPKEFQAAGKPVIVPDEPNLHNHVTHMETGVIAPPTQDGVEWGVSEVLSRDWGREKIQHAAEQWSVERFRDRVRSEVESGPIAGSPGL